MMALTAIQAKTVAYTDLVVHNEIDTLARAIIAAGLGGQYSITVNTGTTITNSTPLIPVTGTTVAPTITALQTVILAGVTVILGTTGTNLNAVIADINDAAIPNLVASKDLTNHLVLTYTAPMNAWAFIIGAGTANVALGLTAGTVPATLPISVAYFTTFTGGLVIDRKQAYNMAAVMLHFQNLGYNISQSINLTTNNTLAWNISW
jgi:hypothetical protein